MHEAVGRRQTATDALDPARAAALHATLGRRGAAPGAGDPLPLFWHQIYFWDTRPPDQLGRDGHPRIGRLIPNLGLPQRMWAGGALEFHAPVLLGEAAEKTTVVEAVEEKTGRSGRLGFVTLCHEIRQNGQLAVRERQNVVYREPPGDRAASPKPPDAPSDDVRSQNATFSPTLLFRYSALTFNGHRIHYDVDYCREVEGYSGLVVHGPLLAQLLIHLAEDTLGPLAEFEFRATSALMHHESAVLCLGEHGRLWVWGPDGRQCMTARAVPA